MSDGLMRRIKSVQNTAARLVTGARHRDHIMLICDNCTQCTGCLCDNKSSSRSLSWSSSVYPAMHRRIWQTTVSSSLMSARADSARLTQRCVLFDIHTTPSAVGVSQQLDHACGTRCPPNYNNATVSESSNDC